ncbi:UDP-glycosyltransferase 79B6-like protein, partial [Corchorus olitorius]
IARHGSEHKQKHPNARNSLTLDHSESLDASGFCGGAWLLLNESDHSEVEILSKGPLS